MKHLHAKIISLFSTFTKGICLILSTFLLEKEQLKQAQAH